MISKRRRKGGRDRLSTAVSVYFLLLLLGLAGPHSVYADDAASQEAPLMVAEATEQLSASVPGFQVDEVTLTQALRQLSQESGLRIGFSSASVGSVEPVSCDCHDLSASQVLNLLLQGTGLEYVLVGEHVVIRQADLSSGPKTGTSRFSARPTEAFHRIASRNSDQAARVGSAAVPITGEVAGQVTNAQTGQPVSAAQVAIVGTQLGSLTTARGEFSISGVPAGDHTVEVQLLGFTTVRQPITVVQGETVTINISLEEAAIALDEIVATVSARAQRRVEVGVDVERLDISSEIETAVVSTFSELLMARAPGVSIDDVSGQAGAAQPIEVRGRTSLTQSNVPIVKINNIRISNNTYAGPKSFDFGNLDSQSISRMNDLNPWDLRDLQVEKGPSAAALHGSEAGAGVVQLRTRGGQVGEPQFSLSTETSLSWDVQDYPDSYFNATQHAGIGDPSHPVFDQWRSYQDPVTGELWLIDNPLNDRDRTPLRRGLAQDTHLSVSGGSADFGTYYASARYQSEEGVLTGNDLERINITGSFRTQLRESLAFEFTGMYVDSEISVPHNDHSAFGVITNGWIGQPLYSFGSRGDCMATVLFGEPETRCEELQGNLIANFDQLLALDNGESLGRTIAGLSLDWTPNSWLTGRVSGGIDRIQTETWQFVPVDDARPFADRSRGFLIDQRDSDVRYSADYVLTADYGLGDTWSFASTVGGHYVENEWDQTGCTASGFANNTATACDAAEEFAPFQNRVFHAEAGAFVHQQFNYRDFAYITGGIRYDDNSGFGERQSGIWSPSVNASFLLTDMPFLPDAPRWMDELRVRAAWGKGAQAPAPYVAQRSYRPVRLAVAGSQRSGITPSQPGNPDLTAERNEEIEVGFDASFLDNRVDARFTYFNQSVTDAIMNRGVAPSIGFLRSQPVNVGRVSNSGIETSLRWDVVRRTGWSWDMGISHYTQGPIIEDLGDINPTFTFREGYVPGMRTAEVVESATRDADGNITDVQMRVGEIEDRVYLGAPHPTNRQSLRSGVSFGGLRISTVFQRAGGFVLQDMGERYRTPLSPGFMNGPMWAKRRELSPEMQAAIERGGTARQAVFTSQADYIKWQELSATYQVPATLAQRAFGGAVSGARVRVGARNLGLITSYEGFHPELNKGGGADQHSRTAYYNLPPPLRFTIGATVVF